MTSAPINPAQRWSQHNPCSVCGGYADLPQHQGVRCWGFLSSDGLYAHCTREEYAGALLPHDGGDTYAHRLTGDCRCGHPHQPNDYGSPAAVPQRNGAVAAGVQRHAAPVVAEMNYRSVDADGVVVALHRRLDRADGSKGFQWVRPDGELSRGDIKPEALPLYRLPELLAAGADELVYFTEGEKACDAARALGVLAVCCGGGAGQRTFGDAFAPLKGRRVALLPDNDSEGRAYMGRVAVAMHQAGARTVEVELPGLPLHGDIVEWIAAGGTREALTALVRAAAAAKQTAKPALPHIDNAPELLRREFPPQRFAVPGIVPEGMTIFGGRPKMGKSWLVLSLGLAIASGGYALGAVPVEQGDVLILALEDGPRRIKTRLLQLLGGAEAPAALHVATAWPRLGKGGIEQLQAWLATHPNARMVVIDTFAKFRPLRSSQSQGYSEDYSDADALQKLAQGANVALLVVTHTRKAPADDFLDEISGTLGLSGGADAGLVLRRERGRADAMLVGSGRDLEHDVDLALTWDTTLTSWTIAGSATDYRRSAEQQAIYDILAEMREPATAKDVADILGKTYGAARFLLWKMAHAGTLDVRGGKYTIREAAGDAI